jgi:predicted lysophospholipase L1 biosynthesis ABC-type transport system permease subunit
VLNATAAHLFFPHGPALGERLPVTVISPDGVPITAVGIVENARQRDITIRPFPEIVFPIAQRDEVYRVVHVSMRTTTAPELVAREVRRIIGEIDPQLTTYRVSTMDDIVRATLAPQRYVLASLGAITVVALTLAGVGVYSVMSQLVATRTHEIGVRMALGARPGAVMWTVMREALRFAALGAAIVGPVAFASSAALARFLYEVSPHDAPTFLAAPLIIAVAAVLAACRPAWRATRVFPAIALRAE